jgi:V8-like Glu-specific endopeptidase
MTRTRSLASGLLTLSAAAVLALASAGGASAAPAPSDGKATPSVASVTVDARGAADYWTPERMQGAVPGDTLAAKAFERGNRSSVLSVEKGKPSTTKGTKGKPTIAKSENPVSHIGKVFFTIGTTNYVCSGNAVASDNGSTVATAGHCVNESGAYVTNFVFVPEYENGNAPYGKWAAKALYAPTQWVSNGDMTYDTGFAVVNPDSDGALLTDVVGGSGTAFNQAYGLTYKAYGYPQASPFNGTSLWSCTGKATKDTNNPQFGTQGIPCDMTGGSSGGPWFIQTDSTTGSDGVQNSINSYGYNGSAVMYGPYWGSVIEATYTNAAAS